MADVRSFALLLQSLEDGELVAHLSDKVAQLNHTMACHAETAGKAKGEIVLRLKLNAERGGTVQIDAEVTTKEPKPARSRSVLWLAKDGSLATENPRQQKLPLREVPAVNEPPRDLGAKRGDVRNV